MSIIKVKTGGITADAITDALIADDVVGTEHLTANEVDTAALGADAVTAAQVADDAISEEHLDVTAITGHAALTSVADDDLVLLSDTSASAALKKMTVANLVANAGGGKVLQVVTDDHATRFVTSSTSYVAATGYSIVITPSATSSKIFLINSGGGADSESSTRLIYGTYYRTISGGSATHIVGDAEGISQVYNQGARTQAPLNMSFLDSPNTTSEITYQIYIKSNGGQVSYNNNEGKAQFTAFEIAG